MVSALTRLFGAHNLALAEDVVQEAFCRAIEAWRVTGIPENPSAWLMTTAKHRALDVLRRERTARTFELALTRFASDERASSLLDEALSVGSVRVAELEMMFSCCHPRLAEEAQIGLILNVLCGFGVDEIAGAFLAGHAAVEKRITRGKKVLAGSSTLFDLGDAAFSSRLATVRRALYLLFNEGYHGASSEEAVRPPLCAEAMRLVELLRSYPPADTPTTCALSALMCLHAARLPARIDDAGDLNTLARQNRELWDARLMGEGLALLERSASGNELSSYHVEAAIAAAHASAPSFEETDFRLIVSLYDRLMAIAPSPVVALNRAIALGERDGAAAGLAELRSIADPDRLAKYPFYAAALGELELKQNHRDRARTHFREALARARNDAERRFLEQRLRACSDA